MKARFNLNFTDGETIILGNDSYEPVFNMKISSSYWQPIIDMRQFNNTPGVDVEVSGPLLSLVREICILLKLR